ncbi:hypothetical protein [Coleofasciculus sp. FACHB-1120]|nr:hypothetical protein [Coleofasciculus sp. FACHB-1120]
MSGLAALGYTVNWVTKSAAVLLRDDPAAIKEASLEALDQCL